VIGRRALLAAGPLACLVPARVALAGAQAEEPIAESALNGLRSAIAGDPREFLRIPQPVFADTEARLHYLRWLGAMNRRLVRWMDWDQRRDFLQTLWYESKRAALDPALVLGLVQVESNFNKFASDASVLFHMQTNLRFGCVILRYYLRDRENGDLFMALGRYNGSRGQPQYPNAVLNAKRAWDWNDPEAR
jgi:soluble lytic murein transglycosylase-like protein